MRNIVNGRIKVNSPEFFFALSYFVFSLIKPILLQNLSISKLILLIAVVLLIVFSIASFNYKLTKINFKSMCLIVSIAYLFFLFDYIMRPNPLIGEYLYSFAIYGIIPLIMIINVKEFDSVLYWWTFWSLITGVMYLADPFLGYRWLGDYMSFGFEAMLPAFAGTCIVLFYYQRKIVIPLMVLIFVETVIFANKGSIITCVAVFILTYCFSNKQFSPKRLFLVIVLGSCLIILRNSILYLFVDLAKQLGVRSYSLITIADALSESGNGLFAGRNELWGSVIECIRKKIMFGYGIGSIEWKLGNYAHNFFLDIVATFGIVLSVFIVAFLIYLFQRIIKFKNKELKYFGFLMFVLWFFPLQFSLTFWKSSPFWIFIAIALYKN